MTAHVRDASIDSEQARTALNARIFPGDSEMAVRMRALDWAATSLGPVDTWPRTLQSYVAMLLELPSPAIIFWGPEQVQIYNDGYATIMGPRHPQYLGAPYRECWPDTYPMIHPWMHRVLAKGEVVRVDREHIPVTRYGFVEEAYFSFTFSPLRDDEGRVAGILQPVFEVTAAVLAERRADTLRTLAPKADSMNPVDDAVAALATNTKCIPLALLYLCDEPSNQFQRAGRGTDASYPEAASAWLAEAARWSFESGAPQTLHGAAPHLGSEPIGPWPEPIETLRVLPIRRSNADARLGSVVFGLSPRLRYDDKYLEFLELVAAQLATALQTRRALYEAQSAARAKDAFLAMLGHELRNPLAPMRTALQLMRLRGVASRELDVIARQVGHVTRLVDDLLDVARITSGKVELRKETVEIATIVARAVETTSSLLESHRHRLVVDVPDRGLAVHVDPERMTQVFSNLLNNAAKYSEPESRIAIEAARIGDQVRVTVRDEGMGIAHDMLGAIFDIFVQQPQTVAQSRGGVGLGLTIVRSLVEMHSGRVAVRSRGVGRGSEFVVELRASHEPLPETVPESRAPVTEPAPGRPRRILVVDDNEDAADMLSHALREVGHTVEVAHDGPTGLQKASLTEPDIAILDIGLPVMDGYQLAERLRALPRRDLDLQLVALTGYGQDPDRLRAAEAGFSRHLVKPVDLEVLRGVIDAL